MPAPTPSLTRLSRSDSQAALALLLPSADERSQQQGLAANKTYVEKCFEHPADEWMTSEVHRRICQAAGIEAPAVMDEDAPNITVAAHVTGQLRQFPLILQQEIMNWGFQRNPELAKRVLVSAKPLLELKDQNLSIESSGSQYILQLFTVKKMPLCIALIDTGILEEEPDLLNAPSSLAAIENGNFLVSLNNVFASLKGLSGKVVTNDEFTKITGNLQTLIASAKEKNRPLPANYLLFLLLRAMTKQIRNEQLDNAWLGRFKEIAKNLVWSGARLDTTFIVTKKQCGDGGCSSRLQKFLEKEQKAFLARNETYTAFQYLFLLYKHYHIAVGQVPAKIHQALIRQLKEASLSIEENSILHRGLSVEALRKHLLSGTTCSDLLTPLTYKKAALPLDEGQFFIGMFGQFNSGRDNHPVYLKEKVFSSVDRRDLEFLSSIQGGLSRVLCKYEIEKLEIYQTFFNEWVCSVLLAMNVGGLLGRLVPPIARAAKNLERLEKSYAEARLELKTLIDRNSEYPLQLCISTSGSVYDQTSVPNAKEFCEFFTQQAEQRAKERVDFQKPEATSFASLLPQVGSSRPRAGSARGYTDQFKINGVNRMGGTASEVGPDQAGATLSVL